MKIDAAFPRARAFLAGLSLVLVLLARPARAAVNAVWFEGGYGLGIDSTFLARAAISQDWNLVLLRAGSWRLDGYWEVSAGAWTGDRVIVDLGLTPVFRFERMQPFLGVRPYVEAAVGGHLISGKHMYHRTFSTLFQFGDHLGFGVRLGGRGQFDLGYRFQHLSNGGIREPNPGINFQILRLGYHF